MAHEEMQTIKELDVTLLDAVKHKLYFYLAEQDDWVGENKRAIIREMADEPHSVRVIHGEHGIPHAYCISTPTISFFSNAYSHLRCARSWNCACGRMSEVVTRQIFPIEHRLIYASYDLTVLPY